MFNFSHHNEIGKAAAAQKFNIVSERVNKDNVNSRDDVHGATLLHWAANKGNLQCVQKLIACGADVNATEAKLGASCLHWAAAGGNAVVTRTLLSSHAILNRVDKRGQTPLHWAAANGLLLVVKELLLWGANIKAVDNNGQTVLHSACFRGHLFVITELLKDASLANMKDNQGFTPGQRFFVEVPTAVQVEVDRLITTARCILVNKRNALDFVKLLKDDNNRSNIKLREDAELERSRLRADIENSVNTGNVAEIDSKISALSALTEALSACQTTRQSRSNDTLIIFSDSENDSRYTPEKPKLGLNGMKRPRKRTEEGFTIYGLDELKAASRSWSKTQVLGSGGFGSVFKGELESEDVAIKRLDEGGMQGKDQFTREVEILSMCRHKNIVPLLGVCQDPPCLVYKLMANNSLRMHLLADKSNLSWRTRIKIALDTASGLEYMHSPTELKPVVVHRDVKPENILLDSDFSACLSDFGISRIDGSMQSRTTEEALEGDFHYMCPELKEGRVAASIKSYMTSDIYGFGVVLCELLTGQSVHDPKRVPPGLVDVVQACSSDSQSLRKAVDCNAGWGKSWAMSFAKLATDCTSKKPLDRPLAAQIVYRLERILAAAEIAQGHCQTDPETLINVCEHNDDLIHRDIQICTTDKLLPGISSFQHESTQFDYTYAPNERLPSISMLAPNENRIMHLGSNWSDPANLFGQYLGQTDLRSNNSTSFLPKSDDKKYDSLGMYNNAAQILLNQNLSEDSEENRQRDDSCTTGMFPCQNLPVPENMNFGGDQGGLNNVNIGCLGNGMNPFLQHTMASSVPTYPTECVMVASLLLDSYSSGVSNAVEVESNRGNMLLSSCPRLLSLCCGNITNGMPAGPNGDTGVLIIDFWQQGRVVFFPLSISAISAAVSPFRGETHLCVQTSSAFKVYSLRRNCIIAELELSSRGLDQGTGVLHWRWLGPSLIALITAWGVFYWFVLPSENPNTNGGFSRTVQGQGLYHVAGYTSSDDGNWGLLNLLSPQKKCLHIELHSFVAQRTFPMSALGASLIIMPGSSPSLNLLALIVKNIVGQPELRVLDLDGSVMNSGGLKDEESLSRLERDVPGSWSLLANHCIFTTSSYNEDMDTDKYLELSPKYFLKQWPGNLSLLCVVSQSGMFRLYDVQSCRELLCYKIAIGPIVEAEIDIERGDLLCLTLTSVIRVGIVPHKLRSWVEVTMGEPELASRAALFEV